MTERNLVGGVRNGLTRGGAGAIESIGGNTGKKLRKEAHLACDVRRQHRGHDLSEDDFIDLPAVQLGAIEQLARRVASERHREYITEYGATLGERSAQASDDREERSQQGRALDHVFALVARGFCCRSVRRRPYPR